MSARLLLFLSLVGAFALAVMSELQQTWMSAAILTLYCLLSVVPLVLIEIMGRRN